MNLTEIKIKFLDYLSEKGKLDDEKYSQLMNSQGSVFLFGAEFTNFIKDNYSALGIKSRDKVSIAVIDSCIHDRLIIVIKIDPVF